MADALVIGGGPAGLMAAEMLLQAGNTVCLVEAKPSVGRKFLMAGKSGLNLTKAEDFAPFLTRYGTTASTLRPILQLFDADSVVRWSEDLGQTTFTGSTGRVFPTVMKASPLLRAWLARLDQLGLERHVRWRWTGWAGNAATFETPEGPRALTPKVTVLALGGASWSRLGSDGAWAGIFKEHQISLTPFAPANAGLNVAWSAHMERHFGKPLKNISLTSKSLESRGEVVISERGLEGGGLYSLSPALRDGGDLHLDLAPNLDLATLTARLAKPRGKQSLSNYLRKTLKASPQALAILMECAHPLPRDPADLAKVIKQLPVPHQGLRPIDEAISTAGGVSFDALTKELMLIERPGVFCAGEMLDWEAPTGGYLLTACFATGRWAGKHAADYLTQV